MGGAAHVSDGTPVRKARGDTPARGGKGGGKAKDRERNARSPSRGSSRGDQSPGPARRGRDAKAGGKGTEKSTAKSGGKGAKGKERPGDWTCPACECNVFASRDTCFKCGAAKPKGPKKAPTGNRKAMKTSLNQKHEENLEAMKQVATVFQTLLKGAMGNGVAFQTEPDRRALRASQQRKAASEAAVDGEGDQRPTADAKCVRERLSALPTGKGYLTDKECLEAAKLLAVRYDIEDVGENILDTGATVNTRRKGKGE